MFCLFIIWVLLSKHRVESVFYSVSRLDTLPLLQGCGDLVLKQCASVFAVRRWTRRSCHRTNTSGRLLPAKQKPQKHFHTDNVAHISSPCHREKRQHPFWSTSRFSNVSAIRSGTGIPFQNSDYRKITNFFLDFLHGNDAAQKP